MSATIVKKVDGPFLFVDQDENFQKRLGNRGIAIEYKSEIYRVDGLDFCIMLWEASKGMTELVHKKTVVRKIFIVNDVILGKHTDLFRLFFLSLVLSKRALRNIHLGSCPQEFPISGFS